MLPENDETNKQLFTAKDAGTIDENTNIKYKKANNKWKFQRLKPHEKYQQNQLLLEEMFNNTNYKRYITIKADEDCNLANINVSKANKQMTEKLKGKTKKVTEIRDCNLLVEINIEQQSKLIRTITKLDEAKVTVTEHPSLNTVKGTIRYKNNPNFSENEIF